MARPYRVLDDAENEVIGTAAVYALETPRLATRFLAAYKETLQQASEFPKSGAPQVGYGNHEVRAFYLDVFPFTVFVAITPGENVVLAVAHQSLAPGYWADRLRELND